MLNIRPAQVGDIPLIQELAFAIWPAAYGQILPAGQLEYMLQLMYSHEALQSQMLDGQQFFIASIGERPVGFAAFGPYSGDTYKLHKLYVLPELQGQGAGRELMLFVMKEAAAQGAVRMILNVNRQNGAFHFYKKIGFKVAETVDVPIGEGYYMNDYVMELYL